MLERLGDKENPPGPTEFRMRFHLTMETGDERYSWLNEALVFASPGRSGDMVIYDAFQLL